MKKPTLSIGIAAYNESKNIGYLLESIVRQNQNNYKFEKIIIVSDGCTDNTVAVIRKFKVKYPFIIHQNFDVRLGKAMALNMIYKIADSDLLLSFDADVVLDRNIEIDLMVEEMLKDKEILLVGGRFIPVIQKTLMGKFSYISYLIIEDSFLNLRSGNNFYALVGAASLIHRKLFKSFDYPKGTISDQNYLFAKATKDGLNKFKLAIDTRIFIRTVSTFKDWRLLGMRSVIEDKASVTHFFGKKILKDYSIPKRIYLKSFIKFFVRSPFYTCGSLLMNLFIRLFPYKKAIIKKGIWELTMSSKEGIVV